jgi:hypothetical protein
VKTVLDVYGQLYDEADVALRGRLEAMFVPVGAAPPTDLCGPSASEARVIPFSTVRPGEGTRSHQHRERACQT